MNYKRKPTVIEAFKWTGDADQLDDPIWIVNAIKKGVVTFSREPLNMYIGMIKVEPGDYVIRGIHGEIYCQKSDIFEKAYEPTSEPSTCFKEY